MLAALDSEIYELTARRRNYLILRLDSFLTDGAATYDPALLTIEHVLPQSAGTTSEWLHDWPNAQQRNYWVHRIANLVPLTQKRNSKAQNFDFRRKKEAYFGGKRGISSYALTSQVLNTNEWTPTVVQTRQKYLMQILAEKWELS
ncbi:HNH endonuclease family protein, partial [uncultured Arthrobacter sp.]|uniref:HNH endonuclease family protein n=1 Tax=uncultured Arthrobacter sp. TaxID=114050 RepID=UPI00321646C2